MTARLEKRSKSSGWGGRRKGAGRKPIPKGDDYEERQAVYDACGAILDLLADEMRTIDPTSRLSFVAYYRTGFERAISVVERYRASVRLEREAPVTRVRFVA